MTTTEALSGLRVWLTRPGQRGRQLADALTALGAQVWLAPTLIIQPRKLAHTDQPCWEQLDWLVVVSPTAAELVGPYLPAAKPAHLKLAAVGPGTAEVLRTQGWRNIIVPSKHYSALSLLEELQKYSFQEARVAILRGRDGDPSLLSRFRQWRARVSDIILYERHCPASLALTDKDIDNINIVVCTSLKALQNLQCLLEARHYSKPLTVLVSSRKLQAAIRNQCWTIRRAADAANTSIIEALRQFHQGK